MRTVMLLVGIFVAFIFLLTLGIGVYVAVTADTAFNSINLTIANHTFTDVYDDTLGQGVNAFIDQADLWGMFLLFGMVILMVICGFIFNDNRKLMLIVELAILIIVFIVAGVLQFSYNQVIQASPELLDVYSNSLTKSSTFMLSLPFIVPIVWMLMMWVVYGRFKKKDFEEATSSTQGVGF